MTRPLLALLLLALALPPALADEAPDDARLESLLAAYDRQGGGNTIPIEKEILALREAGATQALARHLGHPRFGSTVAWALSSAADEDVARQVVAAARTWPERTQAMAASSLARLPGKEAATFLRELAAIGDPNVWTRRAVQGALLRTGDEETVRAVKKALVAKDASVVAESLHAVALSYDPAWLSALARLLDDARTLPAKVRSRFKIESTERLDDGRTIHRAESPELETVGQLALEAANLLVRPDTPEMIAWWYELEKGPRFGFGEEGAGRLRHTVACDVQAARRKLPTACAAVDALLAHLRGARPDAESFALERLEVEKDAWRLEARLDEAGLTAHVDASSRVTLD